MMMTALPQTLTPSKTKMCKLKEWTRKMKEGTQKMKEWKLTAE